MDEISEKQIADFTPYILALAAEVSGAAFQRYYKSQYGMLRNEWRVVFHLGQYGSMRAKDICTRARLHKTKVSRAVSALEKKRYISKVQSEQDRREEYLSLTKTGSAVFLDLRKAAYNFDRKLTSDFSEEECQVLRSCLLRISGLDS